MIGPNTQIDYHRPQNSQKVSVGQTIHLYGEVSLAILRDEEGVADVKETVGMVNTLHREETETERKHANRLERSESNEIPKETNRTGCSLPAMKLKSGKGGRELLRLRGIGFFKIRL